MRDAIATDQPEYDGLQVQAEVLGATSYPGGSSGSTGPRKWSEDFDPEIA